MTVMMMLANINRHFICALSPSTYGQSVARRDSIDLTQGEAKAEIIFHKNVFFVTQKNFVLPSWMKGKAYINVGLSVIIRLYEYQFNMYSPYDNQLPGTNRENCKTQTD